MHHLEAVERHFVVPLIASLFISWLLTYHLRGLTRRMGLLDKPGDHKQHEAPTPTLGGLPVFLAFVVGCYLSGPLTSSLLSILQAATALVVVGVCDDIWGVRAKLKLGALFGATVWLWLHGVHLDALGLTGLGSLLLTFLWIGLVSSAFNGVDNADGAAGGLALISALTTFAISWTSQQGDLAAVSLVLGGSCVGFLVFNLPRPRATIFLGDSGSLFLGFGLSTLTVVGEWSTVGWKSACIALLLVAVPLLDFLFILISRGLDGRYKHWEDPIKMCGRDHVSHRLFYLGLAPVQMLCCLYGAAGVAGWAAYTIHKNPELLTFTVLLKSFAVIVLFGLGLKFVPLPKNAFPEN